MARETIFVEVKENGTRVVKKRIDDVGKSSTRAAKGVSSLKLALGSLGLGVVVRQLGGLADAYTSIQNRIRTVVDSTDQLATTTNRLFVIATKTRQPIEALTSLYQKGSIAAKELGASQEELFTFTQAVGNALAIQGGAAGTAAGALLQTSQALGSGIVRAEEFNSILEGAFPLAQAAANGIERFGGSVAKLRAEIIKGKITSDEFFRAILSQSDELAETFGKTVVTIGQAFTNLRTASVQFFGQLDAQIGATRTFSQSIVTLSENLGDVIRAFGIFIVALAANKFGPIIAGIGKTAAATAATTVQVLKGNSANAVALKIEASKITSALNSANAQATKATVIANNTKLELAGVRVTQLALVAERELELTRLKSQISATGRQQSLTRLGAIRRSELAIAGQLTTAENALTAATLRQSQAQALVAATTNAQTAALARLSIGSRVAAVGVRLLAGAVGVLRGLLALLGGPVGILLIAATAFFVFKQRAKQATDELVDFAASADDARAAIVQLTKAQAGAKLIDVDQALRDLRELRIEQESALKRANGPVSSFILDRDPGAEAGLRKAADDRATFAQAEIDTLDGKINNLLTTRKDLEDQINGTLADRIKAEAGSKTSGPDKISDKVSTILEDINRNLAEQQILLGLTNSEARIQAELFDQINQLKKAGASDEVISAQVAASDAGLREIQNLQMQRSVLEEVNGERDLFIEKLRTIAELTSEENGPPQLNQAQGLDAALGGDTSLLDGTLEGDLILAQSKEDMFAKIDELRQADLISDRTATQLKFREEVKFAENKLKNTKTFFGQLSSLSTSENKKVAAIGRAAALTTATIDAAIGIGKAAASAPPPANIPPIIAATAFHATQIAAIASARQLGGDLSSGQLSRVGEGSRPELFESGGKQFMIPPERGRVTPINGGAKEATGGDTGSQGQMGLDLTVKSEENPDGFAEILASSFDTPRIEREIIALIDRNIDEIKQRLN